jgi:hypothetical protein
MEHQIETTQVSVECPVCGMKSQVQESRREALLERFRQDHEREHTA